MHNIQRVGFVCWAVLCTLWLGGLISVLSQIIWYGCYLWIWILSNESLSTFKYSKYREYKWLKEFFFTVSQFRSDAPGVQELCSYLLSLCIMKHTPHAIIACIYNTSKVTNSHEIALILISKPMSELIIFTLKCKRSSEPISTFVKSFHLLTVFTLQMQVV